MKFKKLAEFTLKIFNIWSFDFKTFSSTSAIGKYLYCVAI